MTNYQPLYTNIQTKLQVLPSGKFRLSDLCDNPPAGLGRIFWNDVVKYKKYPDVQWRGSDERSAIYEKVPPHSSL